MHFLAKPALITDFCLALTGLSLAGGSMFLVAYMMTASPQEAAINGKEYLAIYSKPKIPAANSRRRPPAKALDYTPISKIPKHVDRSSIAEFELVDATSHTAMIRTSQGRIIHAARGAILPGGGTVISIDQEAGKWLVRTTNGVIR